MWKPRVGLTETVATEFETGERIEGHFLTWLGFCSFPPTSLTLISPPFKGSSGSYFSNAARQRETVLEPHAFI